MSEAIVIPASQHFEGIDGPWSTFDIRVGDPEQYVRVLVSTASPHSIVALDDEGCSSDVFDEVPPDCAVSRGKLFDRNESSSWEALGLYGINGDGIGLEANLGYEQRAEFGLDKLGIGLTGPDLENQVVAGIATPEPFYLGVLGLNPQPMNFTTLGNDSTTSMITTLKDEDLIPSLAWGFTAGARYRLKQVYGQLVLSGYDASRFEENSVSFTMAEDLTRDLVVALQSISYSGSTSETLLSESIDIFIDSTDPNLWLPEEVCEAFERVFGLTLDDESGLYLVNDTHHDELLNSGAEVSFRLSDVEEGGDTVVVRLPYAAFDLEVDYPLVEEATHYFPLKRAENSTQYTLGRVFLQEAYLSADYERNVFNVSACVWNEGAEEDIVTIASVDDPGAGGGGGGDGDGDPPSDSGDGGLDTGSLVGIIVGSVVGGLLLIIAAVVLLLRKRRKWIRAGYAVDVPKQPEGSPDMAVPVFTSASNSTPDKSNSASVSGPSAVTPVTEATSHSSRLGTVEPVIVNDVPQELDGNDTTVRPSLELEAKELPLPVFRPPSYGAAPGARHMVPLAKRPHPQMSISTAVRGQQAESMSPTDPVSAMSASWGPDDRLPGDISPR